eukprot:TRINITY_DN6148_c0_g1_i2.p1 TRINITY_DN6148_c0_g1~~TRINITY_DN6148_c0_g1_i2.p1  ORF type:complete len:163 (+),score=5.61 TRINITY_DN6148_c0_g1_i2:23-490(+)
MEILLNASRKLLELGLDPNRVIDNRKNTALHLAAVMGSAQLCRLFVDAGADKRATNDDGKMPMDYIQEECAPGLPNTQGMRTPVDFDVTAICISQSISSMKATNEWIMILQDTSALRVLRVRRPGMKGTASEDDPSIDEYSVRKSVSNTRTRGRY